jgi:TolA-binding protein
MKTIQNFIGLFSLMAMIAFTGTVNAQKLTRKEKKAIKKELRQLKKNPEKYVRQQERTQETIEELTDQVDSLQEQVVSLEAQKQGMQVQIDQLNIKYKNLLAEMDRNKQDGIPPGVVYMVQIGYYEDISIPALDTEPKVVHVEQVAGAKRYVIGYFNDLDNAMRFADDIKLLGISDAFVSQYIDGDRNMEFDALEVKGRF